MTRSCLYWQKNGGAMPPLLKTWGGQPPLLPPLVLPLCTTVLYPICKIVAQSVQASCLLFCLWYQWAGVNPFVVSVGWSEPVNICMYVFPVTWGQSILYFKSHYFNDPSISTSFASSSVKSFNYTLYVTSTFYLCSPKLMDVKFWWVSKSLK